MAKQKLVVLTGAGISAESGLRTFRDSDGLWEGYNIEDVATPRAWKRNPQLVLDFYNMRRRGVREAQPNHAHKVLALLEADYDVHIITQNIDDLHERAGSTNVLHLHGARLTIESEVGVGSAFTVYLPAVGEAASPSPPRGEGRGEGDTLRIVSKATAALPPHPNPLPRGERGLGGE